MFCVTVVVLFFPDSTMFTLPNLPYEFAALEPHIDAKTMEIHHGKHHAGYVSKLNSALENSEFADYTIEEVLMSLNDINEADRTAVRNNGGGHYNHSLFWESLTPDVTEPSSELSAAIDYAFTSFDQMKAEFTKAASSRFGSGWAWLVYKEGALAVCSTPNQDNPIMGNSTAGCSGMPILGIDVWEHAYYLHYQNRRPDYIDAFWNVVNWDVVSKRFAAEQ